MLHGSTFRNILNSKYFIPFPHFKLRFSIKLIMSQYAFRQIEASLNNLIYIYIQNIYMNGICLSAYHLKCTIYILYQDIDMLVGGYAIVFIYVLVMLGRWDCVEQKIYLSMGGILGVMMGIVVSVTNKTSLLSSMTLC